MRHSPISLALEQIDFQSGDLFKDLTEVCQSLRGYGQGLSDEAYWQEPGVQKIADVVRKHTRINLIIAAGDEIGPMAALPNFDANHPFVANWLKDAVSEGMRYDGAATARKLMNVMGTNALKGRVDLKNSTISGDYEKVLFDLWLPRKMLDSDRMVSAEGAAAIILHEVGHLFGYLEFMGRTLTTNLVLSGMLRAIDDPGIREAVFVRGIELMHMTPEQRDAALGAKSKVELSCIVMDAAVSASRSELKLNIFDNTGCETVADQFAARHGAARALVVADVEIAKYYRDRERKNRVTTTLLNLIMLVADLFASVLDVLWFAISFLSKYVFFAEYEIPDHNTLRGRYTRLMNEIAQHLKDRTLSAQQKLKLLDDYDTVRSMIANVGNDDLTFARKVSYYLNPRYRNARKFHLLQQDLENLASSNLFAHAAKFSTL